MPMTKISKPFELGGTAQDFALLYNALLDAGAGPTFAAEIARDVVSGGIKFKCDCKK